MNTTYADRNTVIDPVTVRTSYSGKTGCACGCGGSYLEDGRGLTLRINRMQRAIAAGEATVFEGLGDEVIYECENSNPERVTRLYVVERKPAPALRVPEHVTMWIGTTRTVPVRAFHAVEGRTIFEVLTPQGEFEVWTTTMRDDVMVNVYDAEGSRIFSGDAEDGRAAQEIAAVFLSDEHWA